MVWSPFSVDTIYINSCMFSTINDVKFYQRECFMEKRSTKMPAGNFAKYNDIHKVKNLLDSS